MAQTITKADAMQLCGEIIAVIIQGRRQGRVSASPESSLEVAQLLVTLATSYARAAGVSEDDVIDRLTETMALSLCFTHEDLLARINARGGAT
jgi:hypothetical protein